MKLKNAGGLIGLQHNHPFMPHPKYEFRTFRVNEEVHAYRHVRRTESLLIQCCHLKRPTSRSSRCPTYQYDA